MHVRTHKRTYTHVHTRAHTYINIHLHTHTHIYTVSLLFQCSATWKIYRNKLQHAVSEDLFTADPFKYASMHPYDNKPM